MRLIGFAVALALSGCSNPDELLPVHGIVMPNDAVEGHVVRLLRHSQELGPQGFRGLCDPSLGQPFKEATADAEGKYGFELLRGEVSSFTGFVNFCFQVETTFPSGSIAWADLGGIVTETPLGPLREWKPSLELDGGFLQFDPVIPLPVELPAVYGPDGYQFNVALNHHAEVTTPDGSIIWEADDRFVVFDGGSYGHYREPLVLDETRLEDFTGMLTLEAELDEHLTYPFGLVLLQAPAVLMRGLPVPVVGTSTAISRGLPCDGFAPPCPLTDGELVSVDAGFREDLVLVLARPALLKTIILRGAAVALPSYGGRRGIDAVISTEDGGTFVVAQDLPFSARQKAFDYPPPIFGPDGGYAYVETVFVAIPVDAGAPAVSVKLLFPNGLMSISEVSLFE